MTEINMHRYGHNLKSTGGALTVESFDDFFVHTCEDQPQDKKVYGETRIPAGRYEIKLRQSGGMNREYGERYEWHEGMLHLQSVPNFTNIYIHPLNNEKQTDGCIGVGYTALSRGGFQIGRSEEAYFDLYTICMLAFDGNDSVFINIFDEQERIMPAGNGQKKGTKKTSKGSTKKSTKKA